MYQNAQLRAAQPFTIDSTPLTNGLKYLGGEIRIIPSGAANANYPLAHTCQRPPRLCDVLDIGTNTAMPTPFPRGATAWSSTIVYLNLPARTAAIVVHLR